MAYGSTIAAISTPSGKGGVAIIRVSGDRALEICSSVFFPRSKIPLASLTPRIQYWGDIRHNGECIDDGMITYFKAPASYTGEDTVEISCHGGILVTKTVLEALLIAGATPAEAGEFTKRAFINGKISLGEAEAIGNLIEAESLEKIKLTSVASRSRLAEAISDIRARLTNLLSSVFARIDYPDEDLGEFDDEESIKRLTAVKEKIENLLATYPTGRAIMSGIKTVICGKPNVGKSTLYNAILGEDAAIVTDVEGTTRDVLTRSVPLGRVLLKLSDTAGVRSEERADAVEKIGIERTLGAIHNSELAIAVFDSSREADAEDASLLAALSEVDYPKIAVFNKCELERRFDRSFTEGGFDAVIEVSVLTDAQSAVSLISKAIDSLFTDERISVSADAVISSARESASLRAALSYVIAAIDAHRAGVYADAAASEIELALGAISELDGRAVSEEVVSDIFSKFCVGK